MRFSCPCLREPFVTISLRELNVVSAGALAEVPWDGVTWVKAEECPAGKGQLNARRVRANKSSEGLAIQYQTRTEHITGIRLKRKCTQPTKSDFFFNNWELQYWNTSIGLWCGIPSASTQGLSTVLFVAPVKSTLLCVTVCPYTSDQSLCRLCFFS